MLASLAAAAVIAVCPPAGAVAPVADPDLPAADALIACVGATPITGERFSHWLAIARKSDLGFTPEDERAQVMQFLVSAAWIEGEAAARGIVVSDRAVRRRFTRQKHASFKTEREFERFLAETGMTRSDIKYRVRLDIVSERVRRQVIGKGSPRAQQRRLNRFVRRFRSRWRARTTCQPNYVIDDCGATFASS